MPDLVGRDLRPSAFLLHPLYLVAKPPCAARCGHAGHHRRGDPPAASVQDAIRPRAKAPVNTRHARGRLLKRSNARQREIRAQVNRARMPLRWIALAAVLGALSGCASAPPVRAPHNGYCVADHGCYRVLASATGYRATGVASWYGTGDAGQPTASGMPFDPNAMRIANKVLPFGTWVRIRNLRNGREAVAMVDDRGPFYGGRIIDATPAVARQLGYFLDGTAPVQVVAIPPAELTAAQREAARADERHAIQYAREHPHELLAEAGHFALRGVIDITSTGFHLAVGVVWDTLEVGYDILRHIF